MDPIDIQALFVRRAQERSIIGFCYFDRHCHLQDGEIFIQNVLEKDFDSINLKTKRKGGVAYSFRGNLMAGRGLVSVFAKKSELEQLGIQYDL